MPSTKTSLLCIVLALAYFVDLITGQPAPLPICRPSGVIPPGLQQALITPLQDRRINGTLPSTLPADVLKTEGATFYALYSNVLNVQSWAACPLQQQQQQQQQQQFPAPKGWSPMKVVTMKGIYKDKPVDVPTMVILQDTVSSLLCKFGKRLGSSHMVMLLRGTMLQSDWQYSNSYKLMRSPDYGPGLLHSGAVNATSQLWQNGVQQILDNVFTSGCIPSHITIAGHSLGGGGATLLALRVAKYIQNWGHKRSSPPLVTAVLFGAPAIGDHTFADEFNRHVNARKLEYDTDPYTSIFLDWMPDQSKPNPQYSRVGGLIRFGAEAMAFQTPVWQALGKTELTSPFLATQLKQATGQSISGFDAWTGATHTCSYLCISSNVTKAVNNWCLLHQDTASVTGKSATYCANPNQVTEGNLFPTVPPYP